MIEKRVLDTMEEYQITREEAVRALDLRALAEEWIRVKNPHEEEKNR